MLKSRRKMVFVKAFHCGADHDAKLDESERAKALNANRISHSTEGFV